MMRNPYRLPRRGDFLRFLLAKWSRGLTLADTEEGLINEVDFWPTETAEEAAAVVFELLAARETRSYDECLLGANEAAEIWLARFEAELTTGYNRFGDPTDLGAAARRVWHSVCHTPREENA